MQEAALLPLLPINSSYKPPGWGVGGAVQLPAMFKFILATLANVHPFFMGGTSGRFPSLRLRLLSLKCRIMFPVCASSIFQFGGGTEQHAGHVGDRAHDCVQTFHRSSSAERRVIAARAERSPRTHVEQKSMKNE